MANLQIWLQILRKFVEVSSYVIGERFGGGGGQKGCPVVRQTQFDGMGEKGVCYTIGAKLFVFYIYWFCPSEVEMSITALLTE